MCLPARGQEILPGASPPWSVGPEDAPVSIEVFNDYQCPPCATFHETLKKIAAKYEGRVRIIFRNYPLTAMHRNSYAAAQAAEAAGLQDKLIPMLDRLYKYQAQWAASDDVRELFSSYARELNIDMGRFDVDMDGMFVRERIRLDVERANSLAVTGTPTTFVNGQLMTSRKQENIERIVGDILKAGAR